MSLPALAVAVAQPACVPGDVVANVTAHADAVRTAGARLVVFPELSLTGCVLDAPAVVLGGGVLGPLVDACAAAGVVAVVGAPVADGVDRFIAMLEVSATGVRLAYRKMCLGGDEPDFFRAGDAAGVVEVHGWRVGIGVCKDTRMAVHLDAVRGAGIDLYVAGLVHHRHGSGVPGCRGVLRGLGSGWRMRCGLWRFAGLGRALGARSVTRLSGDVSAFRRQVSAFVDLAVARREEHRG